MIMAAKKEASSIKMMKKRKTKKTEIVRAMVLNSKRNQM
jgi:hypothetical protein